MIGISINWVFEPSIVIGLALWTITYTLAVNPVRRQLHWGEPIPLARQMAFHLGTFSAVVALLSPLDTLSDVYLFSAHMTQHMLLMFVAAPLWLIGTSGWMIQCLVPTHKAHKVLAWLTQPVIAFLTFNGVMWLWHIPFIYDAALQHEPLHIIEHLLFIGTALIGWWPILGPAIDHELTTSPLMKLGYLVASMIACSALGVLITLSQHQLFTYYGNASLSLGLKPLDDQQIGGAIMWVVGDMIYVSLIGLVFYRWLENSPSTLHLENHKSIGVS